MNTIRIVNLKKPEKILKYPTFRVDRQTPVGNDHRISDGQSRDKVCDLYEEEFQQKIENDSKFREYIDEIYTTFLRSDINLACHCFPSRCHAQTIKKHLEDKFKKENQK